MIEGRAAAQFLSGRLGALALLLAYQMLLGRTMTPEAYAAYALTLAWSGLGQTLLGLGVPRVYSRFLSGIGRGVAPGAGRRLLLAGCVLRLASGALAGGVALLAAVLVSRNAAPVVLAGAAAGTLGLLQFELDAAAQALRLQRAARGAAIGEAAARLAATAALASAGAVSAATVLWIAAATAGAASATLIAAAAARLAQGPQGRNGAEPDWTAVRRTAFGGHAGALAWALTSPPVIRILARAALPTEAFAGFSFVQALVSSVQRYAPSVILFPLVEPVVMAEAAAGARARLKAVLALLVKLDALAVGLGVAASAGVAVLVPVLAHGRYGGAAAFAPWLLGLLLISGAHRAYEVAAIAVNAPEALGRALLISLAALASAVLAVHVVGWPALLFWPVAEGSVRLRTVQRALDRADVRDLLDLPRLSRIVLAAAVAGAAGWAVVEGWAPRRMLIVLTGGLSAFGFLIAAFIVRPFGAEERDLLQRLRDRLFRKPPPRPLQVVVLTPRGRGGPGGIDRLMDSLRPRLSAEPGVRVRFLTTRGRNRWVSPMVTIIAVLRLVVWLMVGRADIVHVNLGAGASVARKRLFAALCRAFYRPYLLHLHGSGFDLFWAAAPPAQQVQVRRLFETAARVLVLGEVWRGMVAARAPRAMLSVLPNASEPIARVGADGPARLLFLGEIGPRKGVGVLLEALARLPPHQLWTATIAGEGDAAAYRAEAVRLGLEERIAFPGLLTPEATRAALAAADILVLPSFEENLPMAVVEAMGAGLAVLTTPVGAIPELIRDGETGLLVPPGDAAALTGALARLIGDEALRRCLGEGARAWHSRHLSLDAYVPALVAEWRAAHGAYL